MDKEEQQVPASQPRARARAPFLDQLRQQRPEVAAKPELSPEQLRLSKSKAPQWRCLRCKQYMAQPLAESHMTSHASEIFPWLYLGGVRNAHNKKELVWWTGVTHIINLAEEVQNIFEQCPVGCKCASGYAEECEGRVAAGAGDRPLLFKYNNMRIRDAAGEEIYTKFEHAADIIEEARQSGGRVLVHCVAGISRSSAVAIGYCMRSQGWSLRRAYEFVKAQRPIISPIRYFVEELQKYEQQLAASGRALDGYTGHPSLAVDDVYPQDKILLPASAWRSDARRT